MGIFGVSEENAIKDGIWIYARPHPVPLPRGEGEPFCSARTVISSLAFGALDKLKNAVIETTISNISST